MEHKSLFYNELAVFRVSKTSTLKTAYYLIANDLRTTPERVTGRDKRLLAKPQLLQPGGELVLRYQVVDGDAEPAGEDQQYDDDDLLDRVNIEMPDFDGGLDGKDNAYNLNNKSYHNDKN